MYFLKLLVLLFLLSFAVHAGERRIDVNTGTELRNAVKKADPGVRIVLADGVYDLRGDVKITRLGTKDHPIRIEAKHRGKATIVGESHFILTAAAHIVMEGLNFESMNGPAIELRGCAHVQITRNIFHLKETRRGSWIMVDGIKKDTVTLSGHNRIDHNLFEKKSQLGNFITIEGTKRSQPQLSQYDRIDHNLFAEIGPRVENVLEAIRAGSSDYSLSSGFTVIEENLFERCDGDPEYISIKSSDDTIRRNTFRECLGSLSLRHGNRNTVDGNYVLGNGRTGVFLDSTGKTWTLGTGGVRFYGNGMRIINNYFEGLTGTRWDATLAITAGNAEYGDGQPLTKHFRIHDATIASNILVNNASNVEIGYDGGGFQGNWWHLPPTGLHIAGNIVTGSRDTLIHIFTRPVQTAWENNIAWPTGSAVAASGPIAGVRISDPQLVKDGGTWRSPDRQVRFHPLTRSDVGPDAD
jgi:poly(beta-D-mannuronate) lyase